MVTGFLEGLHTLYEITVFIVGLIPRRAMSVCGEETFHGFI